MIFYDTIPPDKFTIGRKYKVVGQWDQCSDRIVELKSSNDYTAYRFADSSFRQWSKHGYYRYREDVKLRLLKTNFDAMSIIKRLICNKVTRLIPL